MSGLIWVQTFDSLIVFLKVFFQQMILEKKIQQTTKKHVGKDLNIEREFSLLLYGTTVMMKCILR